MQVGQMAWQPPIMKMHACMHLLWLWLRESQPAIAPSLLACLHHMWSQVQTGAEGFCLQAPRPQPSHLGGLCVAAAPSAGVPLDVVGGTSQGAFMAALYAQGLSRTALQVSKQCRTHQLANAQAGRWHTQGP